jgi:AcrR family transcriptional regulator
MRWLQRSPIGYPSTTVAELVRRAQTSRRTFYEFFADRDACYAALLVEHNTKLVSDIVAAVDGEATGIPRSSRPWIPGSRWVRPIQRRY